MPPTGRAIGKPRSSPIAPPRSAPVPGLPGDFQSYFRKPPQPVRPVCPKDTDKACRPALARKDQPWIPEKTAGNRPLMGSKTITCVVTTLVESAFLPRCSCVGFSCGSRGLLRLSSSRNEQVRWWGSWVTTRMSGPSGSTGQRHEETPMRHPAHTRKAASLGNPMGMPSYPGCP